MYVKKMFSAFHGGCGVVLGGFNSLKYAKKNNNNKMNDEVDVA